jgi:hypothetical protein
VTAQLQLVVVVLIKSIKSDLEGQMRHTAEKKERDEEGIKENVKEITEV